MTASAPKFVYAIYIATTPEKLWTALTDGEFTATYFFGRRVESDWRVGSPITYRKEDGGVDIQGEVLECDPPLRLSFTFTGEGDVYVRPRPSRVTFELKPIGSLVKLTLVHDGLIAEDYEEDPNTFRGLNNGWPAILSGLKSVLETGQALAFSAT